MKKIIKILKEEFSEVPSDDKSVRNFGFLIGTVASVVWGWQLLFHAVWNWWAFLIFLFTVHLAVFFKSALRPLYNIWMLIAVILGYVVTRVLLTLFYFLVITPIGVIGRLAGTGFLEIKKDADAETYWVKKPDDESVQRIDKQF